jgi:hypothetical protein
MRVRNKPHGKIVVDAEVGFRPTSNEISASIKSGEIHDE